jgi:hypothetical protein
MGTSAARAGIWDSRGAGANRHGPEAGVWEVAVGWPDPKSLMGGVLRESKIVIEMRWPWILEAVGFASHLFP